MSDAIYFDSKIKKLGNFQSDWSQEIVKNEPMFFNCDSKFAIENGGPITKEFLNNLPEDWKNSEFVLDSRVHMLMPGWYSCIPGWHHDDVPRNKDKFGQPNYINPEYRAEHIMGLVNAEICPTEFVIGKFVMPMPSEDKIIYEEWDKKINEDLTDLDFNLFKEKAKSGEYIQFDWTSFHQGTPSVSSGWRWFIRLSRNTDRTKHITNEIRKQVQIYLEYPKKGW